MAGGAAGGLARLTSVCTMAGLWVRSIFTVWKMSTTPSYRIRSSTMLSVMKTPVLPTPALRGGGGTQGHSGPGPQRTRPRGLRLRPAPAPRCPQPEMGRAGGRSPAVDGDGAVLAELLLGLVHLADEVDEALPGLWHALLRPVRELELPDGPGLAILEHRGPRSGF